MSTRPPVSPRTPRKTPSPSPRKIQRTPEAFNSSFEADISAEKCFPRARKEAESPTQLLVDSFARLSLTSSPKTSVPMILDFDAYDDSDIPDNEEELPAVPRFYYPHGPAVSKAKNDANLANAEQAFSKLPGGIAQKSCDLAEVCRAINFPLYSKRPLFEAISRAAGYKIESGALPPITFQNFSVFWEAMTSKAHDEASRFVFTLACARSSTFPTVREYLVAEDFLSMLDDIIHTYSGLDFLAGSPKYHQYYKEVVLVRIFWTINQSPCTKEKIPVGRLRRSNFIRTLAKLERIDEINDITEYFSYAHFFVIYCSFSELDDDKDMQLKPADLKKYDNGGVTSKVIKRIFSGAGMKRAKAQPTMGFSEFAVFMLAEEDKRNPASIAYWFRCLDQDGTEFISVDEIKSFYREVEAQMVKNSLETLNEEDVVCNLLDLVCPVRPSLVTLGDLKKCGLAHRFLNTLINSEKYCDQETTEGDRTYFQNGPSDWDRFCEAEYEFMTAEEGQEEAGA